MGNLLHGTFHIETVVDAGLNQLKFSESKNHQFWFFEEENQN
jgi:hypothetical protein